MYSRELLAPLRAPAWDPLLVPAGQRAPSPFFHAAPTHGQRWAAAPTAPLPPSPLPPPSAAPLQWPSPPPTPTPALATPKSSTRTKTALPVEARAAAAAARAGAATEAAPRAAAAAPLCGESFVSASPGGVLVPQRIADIDALLETIRGAQRTLALSVMDFLPASAYAGGHGGAPVHWPALTDALLAVAFARNVSVRLLVSHWAHTRPQQVAAMRRLAAGLGACEGATPPCAGSLAVRQFFVPGWNETRTTAVGGGAAVGGGGSVADDGSAAWPSFSRVNHAKYIVSEARGNVGTSNWEGGYFYQTAGASLNTDDAALVRAAQEVFDRDWESAYSVPLAPW